MGIARQTLTAWLLELHQGTLPFESDDLDVDTYIERVEQEGVDKQVQLRTAHQLTKGDNPSLTLDEYQAIRRKVDAYYASDFKAHKGSAKVFNPFAMKASPLSFDKDAFEAYSRGEITLDEYTNRLGVTAATGKVPEATGTKRRAKSTDPLRNKNGRFLAGVAELWYYEPSTGTLDRRMFLNATTPKTEIHTFTGMGIKGASPKTPHVVETVTGRTAIAEAFRKAAEIQATWRSMGLEEDAVWVKFRCYGDSDGNRNVVLASATGMVLNPQAVVRLQGQALGMGIKSKVGEVMCSTPKKHIALMLAQGKQIRESLGFDPEVRKVISGHGVDFPCVEPNDPRTIAYTVKYRSAEYYGSEGTIMQHDEVPLADDKDEDGNVILPGHKKMAYALLLDSASERADTPMTVKYAVYGKDDEQPQVFVIGRDEAARWAMGPEDEALLDLRERFKAGELGSEEYMQARYKRLQVIDPPEPKRGKQTTTSGRTNLNYNSDGTLNWQKAQNDGGPGVRWVASITGGSNWGASVEAL